jgi:hypothetical protein
VRLLARLAREYRIAGRPADRNADRLPRLIDDAVPFLDVERLPKIAAAPDRCADDFVRRRRGRRPGLGENDLIAVCQSGYSCR